METNSPKADHAKSPAKNLVMAQGLCALGLAIGAGGIYVGETDDAPGAALLGLLPMAGLLAFGVQTARRKAP